MKLCKIHPLPLLPPLKISLRYSICEGIACHSECQNRALCECLLCFKLNFPWIIVERWNLENCGYVCKCFTIYCKSFVAIYYPLIFVIVCGHVCLLTFRLQEDEGEWEAKTGIYGNPKKREKLETGSWWMNFKSVYDLWMLAG